MTTEQANEPHIAQVRRHLMDTLQDLRSRDNPMDISRAKAVAEVAIVLVDTARVENDYLKITQQDHSKFLGLPAANATTVIPGNAPGILSITQHKLKG